MRTDGRTLAAMTLAVALAIGMGACANALESPPPNFTAWLGRAGFAFEARDAPPDVLDPDAVVADLRFAPFPPGVPEAADARTSFGTLVCRDPANGCTDGPVDVTAPLAVWLVVWPDVPGHADGRAWAIVDARTGAALIGDGPSSR